MQSTASACCLSSGLSRYEGDLHLDVVGLLPFTVPDVAVDREERDIYTPTCVESALWRALGETL